MEGTFNNPRIAQRRPVSVSVPTRDKLLFVGRVEFTESKLVLTTPQVTVTTRIVESIVETLSVEVQPQQQYSQLTPIYKKPEPVQPIAPHTKGIEWKHAHTIVPHVVKQQASVQQPVVVEHPVVATVEVPIAELMRLELEEQILTAVVDAQDPVETRVQQETEVPIVEITTDSTITVSNDLADGAVAMSQPDEDRLNDLRQYFQQSLAQQVTTNEQENTTTDKPKVSKLYRIIRPIAFVMILVCAPSVILSLQSNSTPSQPTNKPAYAQQASASKTAPVVAPDEPKYITISKLGIHAPVTSVGLTTPGAVGSPADPSSAGWYSGSVKPGQPGATYIDGGSSKIQGAVFSYLDTLNVGDQIQIEKGDGTIVTYQVAHTATVPTGGVDITSLLKPYSGTSGLNISTVTGDSAGTSNNTKDVFIVYAVQV